MEDSSHQRTYFSISEFSEQTGLSESTVRRRIREQQIPACQPGGTKTRWLIPADCLNQSSIHTSAEFRRDDLSAPQTNNKRLPGPRPRWQAN